MNIYDDAMRRHIASVMTKKVDGNWFSERVINRLHVNQVYRITEKLEQEQNDSSSTVGYERALEISHYHHVIRVNPDIFPGYCSRNSSNVAKHGGLPLTWMHEIADWRNVHAHPPPDDLKAEDVDRVLDSMIRVLSLCDQAAAKQVRKLVPASVQPKKIQIRRAIPTDAQLTAARQEHEKAQRERALAQSEHEEARRKLAQAQEYKDSAKRMLTEAEQVREAAQQSTQRAKQQLTRVREEHSELLRERRSVPRRDQRTSELTHYRNKFKKASTGNGWKYTTPLGDWQVTRWLGQVRGVIRACVFSPAKRISDEWVNSQQHPLVQEQFDSEEKAFAWLYEQDEANIVGVSARKSIDDFEKNVKRPPVMEDEFYDDIPF